MALLRGLSPEAWALAATPSWTVRDVASHLLDTDLRRLSLQRDGHPPVPPDTPIRDYAGLVAFLNSLNAEWVRAARRLSPRALTDLLALTGPQVAGLLEAMDPAGRAFFDVAWAGERQSEAWLDIAREYTEKWHHQQQVRQAVGAPLQAEPRWLRPLLEVSLLALPRVYGPVAAEAGAEVAVRIDGPSGGRYRLRREAERWSIGAERPGAPEPAASVALDEDTAWRLFFKMLPPAEAERRVRRSGAKALGDAFLGALAVMA